MSAWFCIVFQNNIFFYYNVQIVEFSSVVDPVLAYNRIQGFVLQTNRDFQNSMKEYSR